MPVTAGSVVGRAHRALLCPAEPKGASVCRAEGRPAPLQAFCASPRDPRCLHAPGLCV